MTGDDTAHDVTKSETKSTTTDRVPPADTQPQTDWTDREYLRITPSDTGVSLGAVESQFVRLFDVAQRTPPEPEQAWQRLIQTVFGAEQTAQAIEWLIVTDGDPSRPLQYYVGIGETADGGGTQTDTGRTDGGVATAHAAASTEEIDEFRRVIRGLFPNDYQIERVRWHPARLLGDEQRDQGDHAVSTHTIDDSDEGGDTTATATADVDVDVDGETTAVTDDNPTEAHTTDDSYSAVEYVGKATRRADWQTRLTPLQTWLGDDTSARPPLGEVVDTLASSPVPMVYQVVLTPLPSWSGVVSERRYALLEGRDTPVQRWVRDLGFGSDDYAATNREKLEKRRRDDDDGFLRSTSGAKGTPVHRVRTIETRDIEHSFVVNARVVGRGPPGVVDNRCGSLAGALGGLSGPYHRVVGRHRSGRRAVKLRDALCARRVYEPTYERPRSRLPFVSNRSRGIVADAHESPAFCVIDGERLTPAAMEGLAPTPGERARPHGPPPSRDLLDRYRVPGLTLGQFRSGWTTGVDSKGSGYHQSTPKIQGDESFVIRLPPSLQRLHIAWFGKTGSGKTTGGIIGQLDNHDATEGATILIDQKGDGMATELMRIHFARTGSLEDVIHFDCSQLLPAFSFFDIRDQLAVGVPRESAVEDVVAHYGEMLAQLHDDYHAAGVSVKVIEAVLHALFDHVHGQDAFSHRHFRETLSWMAEQQAAPAVSDPEVEAVLTDAVTGPTREFGNIMTGVMNRVDEVTLQKQLSTMLNHVHATATTESRRVQNNAENESESETESAREDSHEKGSESEGENDDDDAVAPAPDDGESTEAHGETPPQFDLLELLDEDVIIVFDMGGLREEAQRAMTLLVLSNLWTALRRRVQHRQQLYGRTTASTDGETGGGVQDDTSHRDDDGAAEGLGLPLVNLHVEEASTVAVSGVFSDLLKQARSFGCSVTLSMQYPGQLKHADEEAYHEVLNNVSTVVTGNVPLDRDLAARLATEDMAPQEVANRLRALSRGEWLCSLPAGFGEVEPRPFVVESVPLPPGHPDSPQPLPASEELRFEVARVRSADRTRRMYGRTVTRPMTVQRDDTESDGAETDESDAAAGEDPDRRQRVDSALPYTLRLPETVEYTAEQHALECTACENRYNPSPEGMIRAINCCSALSDVDPDDIPITEVNLKLSESERADTGCTDTELMLLQVVYNAEQLRYDAPEYDLLFDSMIRLLEYVGASSEDTQRLIDAGYLTHDSDHPHRLYSVTPAGRTVLGEAYREGVDFGHGQGDLDESSAHVLMVEAMRRYLINGYVADPQSAVVRVVPYYETGDGHRLDLVGLDTDGEIVVVVEAERVNHDIARAVPSDYDKMAACDPEEAIWVVMTTSAAHDVVEALADPIEGEPRIGKSYSRTTAPTEFRFDEPGLTDIFPVKHVLEAIESGVSR